MDPHKKPKYPKTLTERPDAKGDQLGLTSFPTALLRAEVPLDPDELLFVICLCDHIRRHHQSAFPSYYRIGRMMRRHEQTVKKIAQGLHNRGLVPRTKHGRGYNHDLSVLWKMAETAPLIDLRPAATNEQVEPEVIESEEVA